ncbi:glycosyl transferase family 1 [Brevibacillus laterosporus]|uniref:glycosyltransferase family 4 protein n=1 Tax=Brevibacillus laterosporus TaxID=1465 RepID=UPI000BDC777A|nr:glycosyltransferase family 4 protein [Brevibacillus laterosporus]PCN44872.1 glycosyl transferase family 1 [Brevibacillus laterosporus]
MDKRHNVLILSYIFPPIGGGGVPRPLKMAKYLGEFGWGVHVLTADPSYHATLDPSLLADVPTDVHIHRAKELTAKFRKPANNTQASSGKQAAAKQASSNPTGRNNVSDSNSDRVKEQEEDDSKRAVTKAENVASASRQQTEGNVQPSLVARLKSTLFQTAKKIKPYLLIPDDQILWYPEALKVGREIMRKHRIDVIFSTSGPVTNHLVARKLAAEFGCKWIADFRDPWTQNMHRSGIAWRERLEERMEAKVMKQADVITTVTATFAENFQTKYPATANRMELIYNGFDKADFAKLTPAHTAPDRFHAAYAGILYQKRNPRLLLGAIKELIDEGLVDQQEICLSFAGVFDYPGYTENRDCVEQLGLQKVVRVLGNLPHKEALGLMSGADALLMIGDVTPDAGAYIPGKLYEYMGVGKPILALNMPGEATEIIQRFGLGEVANPTDKEAMKRAYLHLYQNWKQQKENGASPKRDESFYDRVKLYERREQAGQLAQVMNELVDGTREAKKAGPVQQ